MLTAGEAMSQFNSGIYLRAVAFVRRALIEKALLWRYSGEPLETSKPAEYLI